jgi:DNA helicase INO80
MPTRDMLWINEEILAIPDYYLNKPAIYEHKTLEQIRNLLLPYNVVKRCVYFPKVLAPPIRIVCSSQKFTSEKTNENSNRLGKMAFFGLDFAFFRKPIEKTTILPIQNLSYLRYPYESVFPYHDQLLFPFNLRENLSKIEIPDFNSLVADSAKLNYLDKMLYKLRKNNHRVLIFCQMTKMLDILEDYLMRKKYPFFRLDGSCNIADRRDMVHEFQTNHKIFAFLLSTRAGGLGVTLTAADTVIFYDNDWNPTMDAQATDRAHRIGQTKEVFIEKFRDLFRFLIGPCL